MKTERRIIHQQSLAITPVFIPLFVGLALLSSCGRVVNPETKQIPITTTTNPNGVPTPDQPDQFLQNYRCTNTAVISPDATDGGQKTGYYKYCQSQSNQNAKYLNIALVETQTTSSAQAPDALCAFPAVRVSNGNIAAVTDPASGYPLGACGYYRDSRTTIGFPSGIQVYDALYIVNYNDAAQMQYCLYYGNPYLCPRYSAGFVR